MTTMTRCSDLSLLPELLTREQEVALARRVEAGVVAGAVLDQSLDLPVDAERSDLEAVRQDGEAAWQHFLLANLKLVAMLAGKSARRSHVEYDEFFQEGVEALAEALRRFDHRQGMRFSTYAYPWVRNAVLRHEVLRGGLAQTPLWRAREARRVHRIRDEMTEELGRTPNLAELAVRLGMRSARVAELLLERAPVPLDESDRSSQLRCPAADVALEGWLRERPAWLCRLGSQEREVLALRHGLDDGCERELAEVARRMGVSVSTVRRTEARALRQARQVLGERPVAA